MGAVVPCARAWRLAARRVALELRSPARPPPRPSRPSRRPSKHPINQPNQPTNHPSYRQATISQPLVLPRPLCRTPYAPISRAQSFPRPSSPPIHSRSRSTHVLAPLSLGRPWLPLSTRPSAPYLRTTCHQHIIARLRDGRPCVGRAQPQPCPHRQGAGTWGAPRCGMCSPTSRRRSAPQRGAAARRSAGIAPVAPTTTQGRSPCRSTYRSARSACVRRTRRPQSALCWGRLQGVHLRGCVGWLHRRARRGVTHRGPDGSSRTHGRRCFTSLIASHEGGHFGCHGSALREAADSGASGSARGSPKLPHRPPIPTKREPYEQDSIQITWATCPRQIAADKKLQVGHGRPSGSTDDVELPSAMHYTHLRCRSSGISLRRPSRPQNAGRPQIPLAGPDILAWAPRRSLAQYRGCDVVGLFIFGTAMSASDRSLPQAVAVADGSMRCAISLAMPFCSAGHLRLAAQRHLCAVECQVCRSSALRHQ